MFTTAGRSLAARSAKLSGADLAWVTELPIGSTGMNNVRKAAAKITRRPAGSVI
jgi:hypothetical protein